MRRPAARFLWNFVVAAGSAPFGNARATATFCPGIEPEPAMRNKFAVLMLTVLGLGLCACGSTREQRAATGAVAGAVVAGPVGAAAGAAAGTAVSKARGD